MRIGLISDTHSYMEEDILQHLEECDEIWHAGDIGEVDLADKLEDFKPFKAVYGNIDDKIVRTVYPLDLFFEVEGLSVFMTHIGGYPGTYTGRVKEILREKRPALYICGHSHILKVMRDKELNMIHMNPGAAGHHGFHVMRTLLRFDIDNAKIQNVEVIELGKRGKIEKG